MSKASDDSHEITSDVLQQVYYCYVECINY